MQTLPISPAPCAPWPAADRTLLVPAATVVDGNVVPGKSTVAYDCELPEGVDAADYEGKKNTATITWTGVDGKNRTADFAADIEFKQAKSIDDTVTVVDDKTVPGTEKVLGTATRANPRRSSPTRPSFRASPASAPPSPTPRCSRKRQVPTTTTRPRPM